MESKNGLICVTCHIRLNREGKYDTMGYKHNKEQSNETDTTSILNDPDGSND